MERKEKIIEVRTADGKTIFSISIVENTADESKQESTDDGNGKSQRKEEFMTDAQKRFLFRLLSEQGLEEKEAHEALKKRFNVTTLKKATKFEASQAIEAILEIQRNQRPETPVRAEKGGDMPW